MKITRDLMSMPVTIDIPGAKKQDIDAVFNRLIEIDNRYSGYKKTSDLSKLWSGELPLAEQSEEFQNIEKECSKYEKLTDGYFSANFSGKYDPTGYVKGWAVAEAAKMAENLGFSTYCIDLSGDMMMRSSTEHVWNIGITDPFDTEAMVGAVAFRDGAVATSGNYYRGNHIINPKYPTKKSDLVSITVVGPDIIECDILATALFAMGLKKATEFIKKTSSYEALFITTDNKFVNTSNFITLK
jgi:thiamine biosynthesis lipoprotein